MCNVSSNYVSKTIRTDFKGKRKFSVGDFNWGGNNKHITIGSKVIITIIHNFIDFRYIMNYQGHRKRSLVTSLDTKRTFYLMEIVLPLCCIYSYILIFQMI